MKCVSFIDKTRALEQYSKCGMKIIKIILRGCPRGEGWFKGGWLQLQPSANKT